MSNILAITYESAIATTPSDTVNDPAGPFAGLYIGVAGTYVVTTIRGTKATFVGLSAGSHPACRHYARMGHRLAGLWRIDTRNGLHAVEG